MGSSEDPITDLVQLITEIDRIDVVALQIRVHDDLDRRKRIIEHSMNFEGESATYKEDHAEKQAGRV